MNHFTSNIQTSAWESTLPLHLHKPTTILSLYICIIIVQIFRDHRPCQRTKYPADKCHYNILAQKLKCILVNYKNDLIQNTHNNSLLKRVISGRLQNNSFTHQPFYMIPMGSGYILARTKLISLQIILLTHSNHLTPYSSRKKLI